MVCNSLLKFPKKWLNRWLALLIDCFSVWMDPMAWSGKVICRDGRDSVGQKGSILSCPCRSIMPPHLYVKRLPLAQVLKSVQAQLKYYRAVLTLLALECICWSALSRINNSSCDKSCSLSTTGHSKLGSKQKKA